MTYVGAAPEAAGAATEAAGAATEAAGAATEAAGAVRSAATRSISSVFNNAIIYEYDLLDPFMQVNTRTLRPTALVHIN